MYLQKKLVITELFSNVPKHILMKSLVEENSAVDKGAQAFDKIKKKVQYMHLYMVESIFAYLVQTGVFFLLTRHEIFSGFDQASFLDTQSQ